jgi:hypothetical protein
MGTTTHSLEVKAPLRAVYHQWTQFEEFPRFMEGVVEIERHDANRLLWKVNIGGKDKEWEAEILEQIPDTRIVWESVDGTQNRGIIAFEPLDFDRTLITLTIEYEPEGLLERAGDALGIPSSQVEGDLNRFRDFIERKEMENGNGEGQNEESVGPVGGREEPIQEKYGESTKERVTRDISPTSADTEEIYLTTDEEGEKMIRGLPSPLGTEAGAQLFPESKTIDSVGTAGESHSEFYRDAGVLKPTHEQVAQRAFEMYVARGLKDGYAREDWLEAEKQLSAEKIVPNAES